jgi:3-oxoacyl-[acyl-carrier protein] reductase
VRRALVFGGTGVVGREILRELARADIPATFTFRTSGDRAQALSTELGHHAVRVDLADEDAVRALAKGVEATLFIHAAATLGPDFRQVQAVNVTSAYAAVQELAPRMTHGGDVVFLGALDRTQSLPLPSPFAASQGALSALAMALAKELGPKRIRVNMLVSGLLTEGISKGLDPKLLEDYKTFSAMRRPGTAAEVARAVRWLACENTYMSGKVVPVNGGI